MLAMHSIEQIRQFEVFHSFTKGKKLSSLKEMDQQYSEKIVMDFLKVRASGKNQSFIFKRNNKFKNLKGNLSIMLNFWIQYKQLLFYNYKIFTSLNLS